MPKFPELQKQMQSLQEEKAAIESKSLPMRQQRDAILSKIQPDLEHIRKLEKDYKAIEQPRLAELSNQIGVLAKAMGGKSLSNNQNDLD